MSRATWYRFRVAAVWLVLGLLDIISGAFVRGSILAAVGVLVVLAFSLVSQRSWVDREGNELVVRNWPLSPARIPVGEIVLVRRGRGVNAIVTELLIQRGGRPRRFSVWARAGENTEELEALVKSGVQPQS